MALKTSMKLVARRIGKAIRSFAAGEGFGSGDFAIAATLDQENERIYLIVGSDREIDKSQWFAGIMNAIRAEFADYPGITMHLVLVIRNAEQLDQVYSRMIVPDGDLDITDWFNPPGQN